MDYRSVTCNKLGKSAETNTMYMGALSDLALESLKSGLVNQKGTLVNRKRALVTK